MMRSMPIEGTDRVEVTMSIRVATPDGKEHWHRLYEEQRVQEPLTETMAIELWAFAAFSDHASAIGHHLSNQISRGQETLIGETFVSNEILRVGAEPAFPGRP